MKAWESSLYILGFLGILGLIVVMFAVGSTQNHQPWTPAPYDRVR